MCKTIKDKPFLKYCNKCINKVQLILFKDSGAEAKIVETFMV